MQNAQLSWLDNPVRSRSSARMLGDTAAVSFLTGISKLAGLGKVVVAARLFGASDSMDAFLMALLIPSFFAEVLASPLDTALVPLLMEHRRGAEGRRLSETITAVVLIAGFAIAAVIGMMTPFLLPLIASSFDASKLESTQRLLYILLATLPLTSLSVVWRAILHAERRFTFPAALAMITPLLSLVALMAIGNRYGVMTLALAHLGGAALETVLSGAAVKRLGYSVLPRWNHSWTLSSQLSSSYPPLVAITLVLFGSMLIDQTFAARLGSGSLSSFSYGTRLLTVLLAIGPAAVGTVILPNMLSEPRTPNRRSLHFYGLAVLAAAVATAAVLMYFSTPLIRFIFQRGEFTSETADLVAAIQQISLIQLPIAVLLTIAVRLTVVKKQNQLLYQAAAISLIAAVLCDSLLSYTHGAAGIAFSGTLVRLVSFLYISCKIWGLRS